MTWADTLFSTRSNINAEATQGSILRRGRSVAKETRYLRIQSRQGSSFVRSRSGCLPAKRTGLDPNRTSIGVAQFTAPKLLASSAVLNNRQRSFKRGKLAAERDYHHEDAKTRRVWCQAAESTHLGCVRYVLASNYDRTG